METALGPDRLVAIGTLGTASSLTFLGIAHHSGFDL
jgi:hypothetical protein